MSANDFDNSRLERIEKKIDQLSEAMISLARAEEKLIAIEKNNFAQYERMNAHSVKLDDIEQRLVACEKSLAIFSKLYWIAISVAAAGLATGYFQN
jgi:DNA repair ATPase RecN